MPFVTYKLFPRNISLEKDDLRRLTDFVILRTNEIREIERGTIQWERLSEERASALRNDLEGAYQPAIFVYGQGGEELLVHNSDIFSAPEFPEVVRRITIDTFIPYQNRTSGASPRSGCRIDLDFSSAKILDWQSNVSAPTLNTSEIQIQGIDDAYTGALLSYLQRLFSSRKNYRNFLHGAFTYDTYLWLLFMPVYFYAVVAFDPQIERLLGDIPTAIRIAIYVYSFFLAANFYRLLIGYVRWTFQCVELSATRSTQNRHRRFWAFLATAIAIPIVLRVFGPK